MSHSSFKNIRQRVHRDLPEHAVADGAGNDERDALSRALFVRQRCLSKPFRRKFRSGGQAELYERSLDLCGIAAEGPRHYGKADGHGMAVRNAVAAECLDGVPGCVARGIPEKVGLEIYAEMMDFAKYAFNKSHAACYAVVAYQTAYLKYYYPVEFMASLMTSVIDNPGKVAEYILVCRQMGIAILPPDINEGEPGFSVSGKSIRYKGVGHPVADAVIAERKQRGVFKNLQDFLSRMSDTEVNKRNVENFIKAGAFDSLEGTRKQFMSVFVQLMDQN